MVKGVMPIHAAPSKVSITRGSGISGRSDSAERGQCRKSSWPQCWYMMGQPGGRARTARRRAARERPVPEKQLAPVLVQDGPTRRACTNRQAVGVIDHLWFHSL